uniref:Integrin, alpha E, tandem duplicate 1 n=1 Tax=Sinocyclocheilus rhinocerous TaxID=307959 RepID=A0A673JXP6_9TELE
MYRGLLFIIVICSVNGFNIQKTPVKYFTNDDPLFGQTVIQSTDGVFVPSPKHGKLFRCTEHECVEVNYDDKKPKGLRPVASVSSLTSEEEQHVMVCIKILKYRDVRYGRQLFFNNNNNNNYYQGQWIGQDSGTEIAFVLDGSGSIQPDDFQRAKDFIYNVMFNVWRACFNCDFAIVQYGAEIRTELSLLDSKDHARALLKVKDIQQIFKITKTASAIHHVLTDIFIPENGSKKNSKKTIIVLSDGKMLGDPMNLTDVLNMPQMKGVTRYSIGVGEGILNDTEAIQEMKEIADPEKFYKVSNYAALDDIQSSLQQSLIGDEDSGTEIAFVLDGSGSIQRDDFQRAKDFIYNVMFNVWNTCFDCNFAIVQYGQEIRTELSLLDNENSARALLKVKDIQQLLKITKTASAIHHVLTDIFIPENGSKSNSRKIIIVLSDGKILGDPMNLTDVLNMPQMKGVTRYSIGVGGGILNDTEAIQEMTQIADPEKFYKVSNYAALNDILSSLQQNLTGIEGKNLEVNDSVTPP